MTLDDIIDFLHDESQGQTLTRKDIERCALLLHDMGNAAGQGEGTPSRPNPFDYTNTWLAEMGYATWRMVLKREGWGVGFIGETLEDSPPEVQHAWRAAAAAIRRRVVTHRLPAEEERNL